MVVRAHAVVVVAQLVVPLRDLLVVVHSEPVVMSLQPQHALLILDVTAIEVLYRFRIFVDDEVPVALLQQPQLAPHEGHGRVDQAGDQGPVLVGRAHQLEHFPLVSLVLLHPV